MKPEDPLHTLRIRAQLDSAVAESFSSGSKKRGIGSAAYRTRDLAREDIFEHVEMLYNRTPRRGHLGGVSPEAFEAAPNIGR